MMYYLTILNKNNQTIFKLVRNNCLVILLIVGIHVLFI